MAWEWVSNIEVYWTRDSVVVRDHTTENFYVPLVSPTDFDNYPDLSSGSSIPLNTLVSQSGTYPFYMMLTSMYDNTPAGSKNVIEFPGGRIESQRGSVYREITWELFSNTSSVTRAGVVRVTGWYDNVNPNLGLALAVNHDERKAFFAGFERGRYSSSTYKAGLYRDMFVPLTSDSEGMSLLYDILFGAAPSSADDFYFYNHSKKVNSTKQPTVGTKISGFFREPFNLVNPVIHIEADNEFPYNYCKWHDSANNLDRYYWIQNKAWFPNKIVQLSLEEDTLATFKTEIGSMSTFVRRSASNFNPLLTDSYYVAEQGVSIPHIDSITPFDVSNGFYVVAVACDDFKLGWINYYFAKIGGIKYFVCREADLNALIEWLNFQGSTGEWADYNPFERIVFVKYIPIPVTWVDVPEDTLLPQYTGSVFLFHHRYKDEDGAWQTAYYEWKLYKTFDLNGEFSKTLLYTMFWNHHPQYDANRKYLDYPPYTTVELKAGPFGQVNVPVNILEQSDTDCAISVEITVDLISGLSRLNLYGGTTPNNDFLFYTEDYCCAIDIPIIYNRYNKYSDVLQRDFQHDVALGQTAVQGVSAAGAAIVGGMTGNAMMTATGVALICNAALTMDKMNRQYAIDSYSMSIPNFSSKGTNGSWIKLEEDWVLIERCRLISGDAPSVVGRPINNQLTINTCSGYLICNAASFESNKAMLLEVSQINDFLNNGFYYE